MATIGSAPRIQVVEVLKMKLMTPASSKMTEKTMPTAIALVT